MSDEYIYLRDYVKILWKRKWIVILVPIISVITTAVIVFGFQKTNPQPQMQIYERVIIIQNGDIGGSIVAKEEGYEIIKMLAGNIASKIQIEDIANTQLFRIKLKNENPDVLEQIAKRYIDMQVDKQAESYAARQKLHLQQREILIKQKQILEDAVSDLQDQIIELPKIKSKDLTELQRFDRLNDYKKRILETKNQIIQKESEINNADNVLSNSKQFLIVSSFNNYDSPCDKKISKKAKLLLSAVFGLMGGVLLAFAIENWSAPGRGGK